MLAFSQGSPESFTVLFRRYKQPIYGFFRRRVTDLAHAEELTQETFLALVRSASRYEPRALFRTYLYAIALKILCAHRRKAAFRATLSRSPRLEPRPFASRRHRIRPLGTPRPRQARLHRPRNPAPPRVRTIKLRRNP